MLYKAATHCRRLSRLVGDSTVTCCLRLFCPAFLLLQDTVLSKPEKQVILLGNLTPQLKCLVVFGNQASSKPGQAQQAGPVNMAEGAFILSGIGA
jgi:hypothetical protein